MLDGLWEWTFLVMFDGLLSGRIRRARSKSVTSWQKNLLTAFGCRVEFNCRELMHLRNRVVQKFFSRQIVRKCPSPVSPT